MNAKRKGIRGKREQMEKDTPTKMSEAERQSILRRYRIEHLELIEPSLRVLERCANGQPTRGASRDSGVDLARTRIVAREVLDVMEMYKGQVGKTISPEAFEALIEAARRRGHWKASMVTDDHEAPKAPTLSEPK